MSKIPLDAVPPRWRSEAALRRLRRDIRRPPGRYFSLRPFLEPAVAAKVRAAFAGARYRPVFNEFSGVSKGSTGFWDLIERPRGALRDLDRFFRSPAFCRWLRDATGHGRPLRCLGLHFKRFRKGHWLEPHADWRDGRRYSLSYSVTRGWPPKDGGALVIGTPASAKSGRWPVRLNPAYNELVLFRLSKDFRHALSPIKARRKTAARYSAVAWYG